MDAEQRDRIVRLPARLDAGSDDVSSPDAIVTALYDVISGEAESAMVRDWDRFRSLFLPGARFVLTRWVSPGSEEEVLREWDVEGFVEAARGFWAATGFWEREIWNRVERFGNIAHVLSTYESRVGSSDSDPVSRGVNSFQLVRCEGRWWIAAIIWDVESTNNPIPPEYLPLG